MVHTIRSVYCQNEGKMRFASILIFGVIEYGDIRHICSWFHVWKVTAWNVKRFSNIGIASKEKKIEHFH